MSWIHTVLLTASLIGSVLTQEETTIPFTSDFTSTVINTPTPSTYKPYQAQLDKTDSTSKTILLSLVNPNSAPAEFGSVDLTYNNYTYTTLYGDVTKGNTEGIVDGVGKAARIREIRCFTQTADGSTIYFGDRYVLRKIDRASGNVSTLLGDPSTAVDIFTSWDAVTFDNINGIVYDNDTGFLYINTDTEGLVVFDLTNQIVSIVIPLAEISSPDSNDYGADLIISPDRKLYMKVSQGINVYSLSDIADVTTDVFNLTESRWVSSIDQNATYLEQTYTFGSTFFGRLGFSPNNTWLSMVDHEQRYIHFINIATGEVKKICDTGSFSDGNTSVCSFTKPYSSVWVTDDLNTNKCASGTLYIFHYYSASRSSRMNYISEAKYDCTLQTTTTTTQQPTTTTTQQPTTTTTQQPTTTTTQQPTTTTTQQPTTTATQQPTTTTTQQPTTTTTQQPTTTTTQQPTTTTTQQPTTTTTQQPTTTAIQQPTTTTTQQPTTTTTQQPTTTTTQQPTTTTTQQPTTTTTQQPTTTTTQKPTTTTQQPTTTTTQQPTTTTTQQLTTTTLLGTTTPNYGTAVIAAGVLVGGVVAIIFVGLIIVMLCVI